MCAAVVCGYLAAAHAYPVRVDASLDAPSRGLWLVKWILVIPHYIVLAFMWLAFVVLSAVAMVAIVVLRSLEAPSGLSRTTRCSHHERGNPDDSAIRRRAARGCARRYHHEMAARKPPPTPRRLTQCIRPREP
jgi:hypothetical protein